MTDEQMEYLRNLGCSFKIEVRPNIDEKPLKDYSSLYTSANFLMDVMAREVAKYPPLLLEMLGDKDSFTVNLTIRRENAEGS